MKYIEVRGTDFVNKGAELMLIAVLNRLNAHLPDSKIVMAPSIMSPYEKRARLGLHQKIQFKILGKQIAHLGQFIPERFQKHFGLVSQNKINLILDASGFSYSDKWGGRSIDDLLNLVSKLDASNTKLIFLPQAYGPFESQDLRAKMSKICDFASLIFVRDEVSYAHIEQLCQNNNKLKLAPDFTSEAYAEGLRFNDWEQDENLITIVPNERLFDKLGSETGEWYIDLIRRLINYSSDQFGAKISLLAFEKHDRNLCQQIANEVDCSAEIVQSDRVETLIKHLAASKLIIGSRYHAIISALSAGVPAIGVGWSHKYEELFDEYSMSRFCLTPKATFDETKILVDELMTSEQARAEVSVALASRNQEKKIQINDMWSSIFNSLDEEKYQ